MLVIGIVGGICSGKSTVAGMFARHGAEVIRADEAAARIAAEEDVIAAMRSRWGDEVIRPDGSLDRAAVSRKVFAPGPAAAAEREFLEGLIHPRVRASIEEALAECRHRGAVAVVLDVPLLLEAGWEPMCDFVLFVDADETTRSRRAAERGWPADELRRREATQLPLSQKQAVAHARIDNEEPLESVQRQVDQLWNRWAAAR